MSDENQLSSYESFLVAECGSVTTTVALFDVVDGVYRLIARASVSTTVSAPWSDIIVGVQQAIARLVEITGRPLLTENGSLIMPAQPTGPGVDNFAATCSAAEPLQAIIVALLEDVSLASARRALQSVYYQEVDFFSLADSRSESEQVKSLLTHQPDLVLVAGGVDGGADRRLLKLVETVEVAASLLPEIRRPHVIYAGNRNLREKVTAVMSSTTPLHVAENVRPRLEAEQLPDTMRLIGDVYEAMKFDVVSGIHDLMEWSRYPLLPTAQAFGGMMEYFAALYKGKVLGVDLGASSVTLASADPQQVRLSVHSDLGMGQPLGALSSDLNIEEILAWMPMEIPAEAVRDHVANKGIFPQTVPMAEAELYLEHAVARWVLSTAVERTSESWEWPSHRLPQFDLLVARGSTLTNVPRPGHTLVTLLNALQPTGIFSVVLDQYGVLPALGILAPYEPLAAVQILEQGALIDLAWVVVPVGSARPGDPVLKIRANIDGKEALNLEAEYGTLEMYPLPTGRTAELTLEPLRNFDIGLGPGKGRTVTIHVGAVGLVIDARGRPLTLPDGAEERMKLVQSWVWGMGG